MPEKKEKTANDFEIFKTIEIGTHDSAELLISEIKSESNRVSSWIKEDVINQDEFSLASKQEKIDLVVLSVADLSFKNGAEYSDIMKRAKELGLDLCPVEVALQLRLAYSEQPKDDYLTVSHKPITDSFGQPLLLHVSRYDHGDRLVSGTYGDLDYCWDSDCRFVFARRK